MLKFIKDYIKRKSWKRKHPCSECEFSLCVSNHSPCYECRDNNKFMEKCDETYEVKWRQWNQIPERNKNE